MQCTWRDPRNGYNGWRFAERKGILVFQAAGITTQEDAGLQPEQAAFPCNWCKPKTPAERPHVHASAQVALWSTLAEIASKLAEIFAKIH